MCRKYISNVEKSKCKSFSLCISVHFFPGKMGHSFLQLFQEVCDALRGKEYLAQTRLGELASAPPASNYF